MMPTMMTSVCRLGTNLRTGAVADAALLGAKPETERRVSAFGSSLPSAHNIERGELQEASTPLL